MTEALNVVPESLVHSSLRQSRVEVVGRLGQDSFPQIVDPSVLQEGDVVHIVQGLEGQRVRQAVVVGLVEGEVALDGMSFPVPRLRAITQEVLDARSHANSLKVLEMLGVESLAELRSRITDDDWITLRKVSVEDLDLQTIGMLPLNPGAQRGAAKWNPYVKGTFLVSIPYVSDDRGHLVPQV